MELNMYLAWMEASVFTCILKVRLTKETYQGHSMHSSRQTLHLHGSSSSRGIFSKKIYNYSKFKQIMLMKFLSTGVSSREEHLLFGSFAFSTHHLVPIYLHSVKRRFGASAGNTLKQVCVKVANTLLSHLS